MNINLINEKKFLLKFSKYLLVGISCMVLLFLFKTGIPLPKADANYAGYCESGSMFTGGDAGDENNWVPDSSCNSAPSDSYGGQPSVYGAQPTVYGAQPYVPEDVYSPPAPEYVPPTEYPSQPSSAYQPPAEYYSAPQPYPVYQPQPNQYQSQQQQIIAPINVSQNANPYLYIPAPIVAPPPVFPPPPIFLPPPPVFPPPPVVLPPPIVQPPVIVQAQPSPVPPIVITPPAGAPITNTNTNTNTNTSNSTSNANATSNTTVTASPVVNTTTTNTVREVVREVPTVHVVTASQPVVTVAGVKTTATELPKTGLPLIAWLAAGFVPAGFKLRRFYKGAQTNESANFIWEERKFKTT